MTVANLPTAGLETQRPPADLRRSGLLGIGWSGLAQMIGMAIRLASNLVLTRLLSPEAYGLFGTAMAVVTTLEWLSDLGVQPALVRHPKGGRPEYLATGWWLGLMRGLTLGAIAAVLAWPLSRAYGQPALCPILLALALRPVLFTLRSPGLPNLRRTLNFRAICLDEVIQTAIGTAVSLALAWQYRSMWSIVGGTLAGALAGVAISYLLCPVRPGRAWDREAAGDIAHLGRQVFLNSLVMALWLNLDRLLGLRFLGGTQMGLYTVAFGLAAVAEGLATRACDVYFSALSRSGDSGSQASWHRSICRRAATWGMPILAAGVMVAPAVIGLLYDRRYADARPIFAILVARLMVRMLGQLQFQYLLATAQVGLATRAYLVALAVQAAILVPLVHLRGVQGLALSALASTVVMTGMQTLLLRRREQEEFTPFLTTLAWAALGLFAASQAEQYLPHIPSLRGTRPPAPHRSNEVTTNVSRRPHRDEMLKRVGLPTRSPRRGFEALEKRDLRAGRALTSAAVLPDGRTLQLVFTGPMPAASGSPDWMPGHAEGVRLTTDSGVELEQIGTVANVAGDQLTWTATYLVEDPADVITLGRADVRVTAGAGLLRDDAGNATAAFSAAPVANGSLVGPDGFTSRDLARGRGGVDLYVSSSQGSDSRSFAQAQNPATPYRTVAQALNQAFNHKMGGKGAAVHLLRGDTFTGGAAIKIGGQDPQHPFILEDYWHDFGKGPDPGTRPLIAIEMATSNASDAINTTGAGGTPAEVNDVVIRRLGLVAQNWTGDVANRTGLSFFRGGHRWTIDDCSIGNFGRNVAFQGIDGPFVGVTLLRDIITDARYDNSVVSGHPEGVYLSKVQGALISQCTLDENGRVSADRSGRDIFSHNVYIQSDCGPAVVWGNVFRAGGSHGIQMRSGGVLAYNYFGRNAIAAFIDAPGGSQYKNVVEAAEDIAPDLPRGFGLSMNSAYGSSLSQVIEFNILVHFAGGQNRSISLDQVGSNSVRNAVVRHNTTVEAGLFKFNAASTAPPSLSSRNDRNLYDSGPLQLYVAPRFDSWDWYRADQNALSSTARPQQATLLGNSVMSTAAWGVVTGGTEANSITTTPTFADAAANLGGFYASTGGIPSEADYVALLRGRMPGVWGTAFEMRAAYDYFAKSYTTTNLPPLGDGAFDFYGASDYRTPRKAAASFHSPDEQTRDASPMPTLLSPESPGPRWIANPSEDARIGMGGACRIPGGPDRPGYAHAPAGLRLSSGKGRNHVRRIGRS